MADSPEFDVFLSHNSKDKPAIRALAALLEERGIRVWLDEDQLIPGRPWQPLLEEGIKASKTGAVLVGKDGLGPWEDQEMQALLRQAVSDKKPVIPVLLPGAGAKPDLPLFLANRTWVDLRDGFTEERLGTLIWGITGRKPQRTGKLTPAHPGMARTSRPPQKQIDIDRSITKELSTFYLFASPAGTPDESPGTVFHEVEDESLAKSLCGLFTREYSDANGLPVFHYKIAEFFSEQDRFLFDESLDRLAVYDDPHPGIYSPEPSKGVLRLAQYAVRARKWQELHERRAGRPRGGRVYQEGKESETGDGKRAAESSDTGGTWAGIDSVLGNCLPGHELPQMPAEDARNSGLVLLMLLAQAYYKTLEQTISMASWCMAVDLKLNHSYFWVVESITSLLKNHQDLRDFPTPFEPLFPDLYPSTIADLEWEGMVAPRAEAFLSEVQRYVARKGIYDPEKESPAWVFVELFRPSINAALEAAESYRRRMQEHCQRLLSPQTPPQKPRKPVDDPGTAANASSQGVTPQVVPLRAPDTAHGDPREPRRHARPSRPKPTQNDEEPMPTHQFNAKRLSQLEELLDIEYEKLHEFEKAIALADGISQKIALRQQIKRDLTPHLRDLEKEYAELLAQAVPEEDIPCTDAAGLVEEVSRAVARAADSPPPDAPQEMLRLLTQIRDKVNASGQAASAKLKASLPIIPLVCSYELEMDTERVLTGVWRKTRDFFKGLLGRP